jgi:hypothetical protein
MNPDSHYDPDRIHRLCIRTPAAHYENDGCDCGLYQLDVTKDDGTKLTMCAPSLESVCVFVREMSPPQFNIVASPNEDLRSLQATIEAARALH